MKYVFCLIFVVLMAISMAGCRVSPVASIGAVAEVYYPNKEGKDQWADPHLSRAASSDVRISGTTRPPVPGDN